MSSAKAEAHRHFAQRVSERFGIVLQAGDIRAIEDAIFAERAAKLVDFSERRAAYVTKVPSCGRLIIALYDNTVPTVITALTMDHVIKRQKELAR